MANITSQATKDRSEARAETPPRVVFFTPRVDIVETDGELTLFAEVPGVRPEDVDLRYENGELVLHGRLKPSANRQSMLLQEYEEGDFHRAFKISESIDISRISAECKNGLLIVHLPKAESVRPRQITVRNA